MLVTDLHHLAAQLNTSRDWVVRRELGRSVWHAEHLVVTESKRESSLRRNRIPAGRYSQSSNRNAVSADDHVAVAVGDADGGVSGRAGRGGVKQRRRRHGV
jgi:hypothetical protein